MEKIKRAQQRHSEEIIANDGENSSPPGVLPNRRQQRRTQQERSRNNRVVVMDKGEFLRPILRLGHKKTMDGHGRNKYSREDIMAYCEGVTCSIEFQPIGKAATIQIKQSHASTS